MAFVSYQCQIIIKTGAGSDGILSATGSLDFDLSLILNIFCINPLIFFFFSWQFGQNLGRILIHIVRKNTSFKFPYKSLPIHYIRNPLEVMCLVSISFIVKPARRHKTLVTGHADFVIHLMLLHYVYFMVRQRTADSITKQAQTKQN